MSGAKVWGPSSPSTELSSAPFNPSVLPPSTYCPILKLRTTEVVDSSSRRLSKGLAVLQRPTRHPSSRHQTAAFVAQIDPSVSVITPMCQPSTTEFMRSVIKHAVPDVKIESIRPLPCDPSQRVFTVEASDGRILMLALSPSPTLRLLRSEKWLALTNLLVTRWLRSTYENAIGPDGKVPPDEISVIDGIGNRLAKGNQHARTRSTDLPKGAVLPYVPVPISNSMPTAEVDAGFYYLTEPTRGISITRLQKPLTMQEKKVVNFQTGRLIRRLSEVRSPNGTFGPAVAVIGSRQQHHGSPPVAIGGSGGAGTWTKAFHSLLEGILRDGEDMAVTISYAPIRYHFRRLSHLLDAVTVARLVVLNAGDDDNVLVSRTATETSDMAHLSKDLIEPSLVSNSHSTEQEAQRSRQTRIRDAGPEGTAAISASSQQTDISVTGLWDWSNTVFGDPLFATVFSRETSLEFLHGFRQAPPPSSPSPWPPPPSPPHTGKGQEDRYGTQQNEASTSANSGTGDDAASSLSSDPDSDTEYDEVVEDRANAAVRLLLYECYHATVSVVRQFYRPDADSPARELTARRRLAAVLARLGDVEEATVGKRPRRASGDAWPAWPPVKRVKRSGG